MLAMLLLLDWCWPVLDAFVGCGQAGPRGHLVSTKLSLAVCRWRFNLCNDNDYSDEDDNIDGDDDIDVDVHHQHQMRLAERKVFYYHGKATQLKILTGSGEESRWW